MTDENFLKNFGSRLRYLRKLRGLKQEELAQRIDKTQDAISGYENGARSMPLKELPILANALDVPVSSLFQDEPGNQLAGELADNLQNYIYEFYPDITQMLKTLGDTKWSMEFFLRIFRIGLHEHLKSLFSILEREKQRENLNSLQIRVDEFAEREKVIVEALNKASEGMSKTEFGALIINSIVRQYFNLKD